LHLRPDKKKTVYPSDGLNLVKILGDRKNRKKTKLAVIFFTFTVLWGIVLNSIEIGIYANTDCSNYTNSLLVYASFIAVLLIKIFCISFFNLEITF